MSGLYLHIPFCASRCIYCDFYSTTQTGLRRPYVEALSHEAMARRSFLAGKADARGLWHCDDPLRTVYLGGGTPSWLGGDLVCELLDAIAQVFDVSLVEEVTLEANPEDVTGEFLAALPIGHPTSAHPLAVNRISMGVQSMIDDELRMLGRRHDSQRVVEAVASCRKHGLDNLSLDLMYGLPGQTLDTWDESIRRILDLRPDHLSAYCLSVEEGTQLERQVNEGRLSPANDDLCVAMARHLRQRVSKAGFEQYEISNYCRPGRHSRHNSSYWVGTPYLGLGPGAHSYDGRNLRCWNEPSLTDYLAGQRQEGCERLSDVDRYNERVMLGLRTRWGVGLSPKEWDERRHDIDDLTQRGWINADASTHRLTLTDEGLSWADEVIRQLMKDT